MLLEQGLANDSPQAKSHSHLFLKITSDWNRALLIHLCIDYSIRHVGTAELSGYNSDHIDLRARHIYCVVLQDKLALGRIQGGMLDSQGKSPFSS